VLISNISSLYKKYKIYMFFFLVNMWGVNYAFQKIICAQRFLNNLLLLFNFFVFHAFRLCIVFFLFTSFGGGLCEAILWTYFLMSKIEFSAVFLLLKPHKLTNRNSKALSLAARSALLNYYLFGALSLAARSVLNYYYFC
jgi:hypothetical protein